jgi:hypothetical protein
VAGGDVNGDGRADIITGAGNPGGPHVKVFSGADGSLLQSFFAYAPSFFGGVTVAAGDVNGDGFADVITGAGAGGGPHVKVFSGKDGSVLDSFFAYDADFFGGVQVSVGFLAGSPSADLVVGAGPGGGAQVRVFSGTTGQPLESFTAYADGFDGAVFTGGACVPAADNVIVWNRATLEAIRLEKSPPPVASRALAMVEAAAFDAVNAIAKKYQVYHVSITAPADASADAAAAAAADRVLLNLFPKEADRFAAILTGSLAFIPEGHGKADGVALGQAVADQILAWRQNDGSKVNKPYTPGSDPGDWVPTPPGYLPALLPQWPDVTPFAMTSGAQFRPAGPPALSSADYAAAFNQVKSLGSVNSTTRTPQQTQIAKFWADGAGTVTPPGHWNEIAQHLSVQHGLSLVDDARLFALLDISEADAAISCWDAKYTYNFWRPVTAIQKADTDGNPLTTPDPAWTPLLVTPNFPSYTSGHSTFSAAAAVVLSGVFGANTTFTTSSDGLPNAAFSFNSFDEAANQAALSRVYAGIHFMFDSQDGLTEGQALGNYVVNGFLKPV